MDANTGQSKTFGVLTTLRQEGEGYRLILDDVEGAGGEGEWKKISLVTFKDFFKAKLDELDFDDKELADFGRLVLIRLKALVSPETPEVIDEASIHWRTQVELDVTKAGSKKRVTLRLSEPILSKRHEDYLCIVSLKGVLHSDKRVYGFDAVQARELSIELIRTLLQDYTVSLPGGGATTVEMLLE